MTSGLYFVVSYILMKYLRVRQRRKQSETVVKNKRRIILRMTNQLTMPGTLGECLNFEFNNVTILRGSVYCSIRIDYCMYAADMGKCVLVHSDRLVSVMFYVIPRGTAQLEGSSVQIQYRVGRTISRNTKQKRKQVEAM